MKSLKTVPIACSGLLSLLLAAPLGPQTLSIESTSSEGAKGDLGSFRPALSEDGRWIAFHSLATNLVAGDTNGFRDVFVHDHQTGQTERISMGFAGQEPDGDCRDASISADGRYVAYYALATNIVPGDTNGTWDAFRHDRQTGATVRISVDALGQQSTGTAGTIDGPWGNHGPPMSANGRFIAFPSNATDLVPGGTNGLVQIFVKDLVTGAVTLASPGPAGQGGMQDSYLPDISANGRFVAYHSGAANLVAGDTNGVHDVFVCELASGKIERASLRGTAVQGNGNSGWPALSGDGRYVAFHSFSTNLVVGDANAEWDVFVRDRATQTTTLESVATDGTQGDLLSGGPSMSDDGRFVAFMSRASTFDPGDTNGVYDVYLRDRVAGTTQWISTYAGNQVDQDCELAQVAPDGSRIAFQTASDQLVPGDPNGAFDVFWWDPWFCATPFVAYCTASTTSIPGCVAAIWGVQVAPPYFSDEIHAAPVPAQKPGICFFGLDGPLDLPFGTQGGRLCVAPPTARTWPKSSGGSPGACDGELSFTLLDLAAAYPSIVSYAGTVHVQVWFRDPASPDGFGLSNALWFVPCLAGVPPPCGELCNPD